MKQTKLSTEAITIVALAALIVALFISISFGVYSGFMYLETHTKQASSNERLDSLAAVLSNIKDAETGARGYLLTGKDAYLEPYHSALSQIDGAIAAVQSGYQGNQEKLALFRDLFHFIDLKVTIVAGTIEVFQQQGRASAIRIVDSDVGKKAMDSIRQIVLQLESLEKSELSMLSESTSRLKRNSEIAYLIIAALTLAYGIAIGSFILFSERRRKLLTQHIQADLDLQKSLKQELMVSNETLAKKIGELDEFTYIASHDLQEPLRKLVAFSQLLKTDLPGQLPPQAESDLFYIIDAGYRMQNLIRDLLDFSHLGRREMMSRVCKLDVCLDRALEDLSLKVKERDAVVSRSDLPEVFADESMMSHVFLNLIGNALKFVPPERRPTIRISSSKYVDSWRIEVADNGIGIDQKYFQQIFAPFKRLHGKEKYEGSGIGLAMCKKIVERHGGTIGVVSKLENGSRFFFTLPLVKPYLIEKGRTL